MTAAFQGGMAPEVSGKMLLSVMEKATLETTGQFVSYKGHVDPW